MSLWRQRQLSAKFLRFFVIYIQFCTKEEAIQCSGKIYSEEHRLKFIIRNDIFRVEKHPMDGGKLILTINRQPIGEWFKEQFDKLRQSLRRPTEEPRKSRGFKL